MKRIIGKAGSLFHHVKHIVDYSKIYADLKYLYPDRRNEAFKLVKDVIKKYEGKIKSYHAHNLDQKDVFLIAYPDHIRGKHSSLKELYHYLNHVEVFTGVHILPAFLSDGDEGYSVVDYLKIDERFGSWADIQTISRKYRTIFDFILNHTSSSHFWFKEFLKGNPDYIDFYITKNTSEENMKAWENVYRPRATPLFHRYKMNNGEKIEVWTTFSKYQVDLNYKNPKVFAKMLDVALFYALHGINILRLDAVGYVWKKENTKCINLEETFKFVSVLRSIFNIVAPHLLLLTETIVPFEENVEYVKNGSDMTYNVALPMMLFYTLFSEDGKKLARWINSLNSVTSNKYFLNVLSTHDGFSIPPVKGLLTKDEIEFVIDEAEKRGALFTLRNTPLQEEVYEINSTLMSMISNNDEHDFERFLLLHSVLLTIPGIPALYLNNVLLDENDYSLVKKTGIARDISRRRFNANQVHLRGRKAHVQQMLFDMIKKRKSIPFLNPKNKVKARWKDGVLTIQRGKFFAFHNFTDSIKEHVLNPDEVFEGEERVTMSLDPYSFYWIENHRKIF